MRFTLFTGPMLLGFVFLTIGGVSAHGLAATQTHTVGQYDIELEYEALEELATGAQTVFTFHLYEANTKESAPFDAVTVRIEQEDKSAVFIGSLAPQPGSKGTASFDIALHEPGGHAFDLTFYRQGKVIATSVFSLQVEPRPLYEKQIEASDNRPSFDKVWLYAILFLLGSLAGVIGYALIERKQSAA